MVTAAMLFYGPMALFSYAVMFWWYGWDLFHPAPGWFVWSLVAIACGLVVCVLSKVFLGQFQWARDMEQEFLTILGPVTPLEALMLAAASGLGEEAFFRGVMQPWLGFFWASCLFALVHYPVTKGLVAWPFFAFVIAFLLGGLYSVSGSLWPPVFCHATVNAVNLYAIGEKARRMGIPKRRFPPDADGF